MDKELAKKNDQILFVKIDNDGFNLGAQRRAIDKNDLTAALVHLRKYSEAILSSEKFKSNSKNVLIVNKALIKEGGDYSLTIDRYRKAETHLNSKFEMVRLGDVCEINPKKSQVKDLPPDTLVSFVPMADLNENRMDFTPKEERKLSEVLGGYTYFKNEDVLLAKVTPCFENGKAGIARNLKNGVGFGSSEYHVLRCSDKVLPAFIYLMVTTEKFKQEGKNRMTGTGGLQRIPKDFIHSFLIPLPPIYIQQQFFNNLGYQKIIDGAKQVVENYKPQIDIDPEWEMVELGGVCEIFGGGTPSKENKGFWTDGSLKWISSKFINSDGKVIGYDLITKAALEGSSSQIAPIGSTILITRVSVGKSAYADDEYAINQDLTALVAHQDKLDNKFLFIVPKFLQEKWNATLRVSVFEA